ncbi:MAG: histidinol phosphate phosphatase domain-containing protein [Nitrospinae bacterium]|nr:histidinol phosphate phosphatase domain-containing protein [Nitrospinota bacterium]
MIDLHTHTLLSDGALVPSELIRRAEVKGIRVLAITDHVDSSNIGHVVPKTVEFCKSLKDCRCIRAIPGAEITHAPLELIPGLVRKCRELGAMIVLVHGETLVEPVPEGTNRVAIESGVDILAHPGLITEGDVRLAAEKGIYLELSGRKGHSYSNGHVAALAMRFGAKLVINSDTHAPGDLMSLEFARNLVKGAGVGEVEEVFRNSRELVERIF